MVRSEINDLVTSSSACFEAHGWILPPMPPWNVTDFGLGAWRSYELALVNFVEHPEYCEKLMYAGGDFVVLEAGHRVTLVPGVWHEFAPFQTSASSARFPLPITTRTITFSSIQTSAPM